MDLNKHKFLMLQILKDIYSDIELANALGFKGGTALMFFYNLNRFSVDLDFNLIAFDREEEVYQKIRSILLKYGTIFDEAKRLFFGPIIVLNYGVGERKLKVEISNRQFDNRYERKNLLGINMQVMVLSDMFAHKLCALLDRNELTNRDIFDTHFFLKQGTPINKHIVEMRMNMSLEEYIDKCITSLERISDKGMLNGLGELMDDESKKFVRTKLRSETIELLRFFREFPIIGNKN
jgi:predicted nucleotidyltransferase component of viral defense system